MEYKIRILQTEEELPGLKPALPVGSVVLQGKNGSVLAAYNFRSRRSDKLLVLLYDPYKQQWSKYLMKNGYTDLLWDAHRRFERKSHRKNGVNYEKLMRHDRRHKHGSGSSRDYVNAVTDYECAKVPLHDFRRCYN